MQVELWPLDRIIPYSRNPRKNDAAVDKVAASLKEYGWRQPIVVDGEGVIVAGHTRYLAARRLELAEAPVHVAAGLTAAQVKSYRLADNRLHQDSEWDYELLPLELGELQDLGVDLALTGFDDVELNEFLSKDVLEDTPSTDAGSFSIPSLPISKLDDLWIMSKHRLLCGDCTDSICIDRLFIKKKAGCIVTDPPYSFGLSSTSQESSKSGSWHDMMNNASWFTSLLISWKSIAPNGLWWMFNNWHSFPIVMRAACDAKEPVDSLLVWDKQWIGPGGTTGLRPSYELIALFANGTATIKDRGQPDIKQCQWSSHKPTGHNAEKPVDLISYLIGLSQGLCYDPFIGSGTSIIAAETEGRICYGMELAPEYVDIAVRRWQTFTGKAAVLEGDGRTFDEIAAERSVEAA